MICLLPTTPSSWPRSGLSTVRMGLSAADRTTAAGRAEVKIIIFCYIIAIAKLKRHVAMRDYAAGVRFGSCKLKSVELRFNRTPCTKSE